ncbi:zinc finger protein 155-like isoform X2 [Toxorhynchites rutilus septentrionalis]|uniref:zinc finger protein 155-like isoform X2 n=1 Tax=Toxorhynchites rutilus septentrionalis TaxID=329112 RepID=UPI00247B21E2|nr:zinc finger protein 155-like isoform X2 [Toxorhynchites rutilus septentrionalis]
MQSNSYSEDSSFTYWNEFDGGPASFALPPQPPPPIVVSQFDNASYNFLPPPAGMPCPIGALVPGTCQNPMMAPVQRSYVRFPPILTPLQSIPQQQYPGCVPPLLHDPSLERTHLNDLGQLEQVVVKNGQVFHISFLDEPAEEESSTLPTPIEDTENEESQSRDWINYDELPLLTNVTGKVTEEGTYKCGMCAKELKSALNLYVHEQTHKTTRLDCNACGKRFNRIGKLEHHIRKHHQKTSDDLPTQNKPSNSPVMNDFSNYCVECEEFFINVEDLQNHMEQNHRLIDDSKYPKTLKKTVGCPYCEETFEWPCMLKTHMTKHTGEKPFICDRCSVSFRFVQSFYRHNRRVHGHEK